MAAQPKQLHSHRGTKREYFLPSWGAHLPDVPILTDYEQGLFPVPNHTREGFDLEYTSLLICDGLVIDTAAYDFIRAPSRQHFKEMVTTVEKLGEVGLLRVEDYGAHSQSLAAAVKAYVDEELKYPISWLPRAREEWRLWKPIMEQNVRRFKNRVNVDRERIPYGILCYLQRISDKFDLAEALRIQAIFESRRMRLSGDEMDVLRETIRPYLTQAVFNQALSLKLQMPFVEWEDMEPYHRRISLPLYSQAELGNLSKEQLDRCRQLFKVTLKGLKPSSVDEVLRFLKTNRAVTSLREEIQRSIDDGTTLDASWADALRDDAAYASVSYRKRERVFKWISRALAAIPLAGHVLAPAAEAIWATVDYGREILDEANARSGEKSLRQFEWYFTLVGQRDHNDAKGRV